MNTYTTRQLRARSEWTRKRTILLSAKPPTERRGTLTPLYTSATTSTIDMTEKPGEKVFPTCLSFLVSASVYNAPWCKGIWYAYCFSSTASATILLFLQRFRT